MNGTIMTASQDTWSADQYLKFEAERNRPVKDLLACIGNYQDGCAIDLGCGPGNSTEMLRDHCPGLSVSGLDASADMIAQARARLPELTFETGTIEDWCGSQSYQVILANASLQWVPDHGSVFPELVRRLAPGGVLAVQMPDNLDEPAHRAMRDIAGRGVWKGILANAAATRATIHHASWYFELLKPFARDVTIWRTTYYHVLAGGTDAVVEWFKGSGLRPYLAALVHEQKIEFLADYTAAMADAYPSSVDGAVLLPFPRLFIVVSR